MDNKYYMVEIGKEGLRNTNTGYKYKQNKAGIVTSLVNMTTCVTNEKYATRFPDVVVVLILRVF